MAVLASDPATSKEESVGLMAHQDVILQIAKELSFAQALKYDRKFREWAAARDIRKCEELFMAAALLVTTAHLPHQPLPSEV